jgi:Domain of unknown function (DUF4352)
LSLKRIIPLLVLAATVLAGCDVGEEDTKTSGKTETDQKAKKDEKGKKKKEKKDPNSCEARGITVREGKTGTCTMNGKSYTVVKRNSTLELKEVAVKVGKITSANSLTGPVGTVRPKKGQVFIVAQFTVRNKLTRSAEFNRQFQQTRLRVTPAGGFPAAPNGESAVPDSFFNQSRKIPAGETQTGSVVFQAKSGVEKALKLRGSDPVILVWNFTEKASKGPASGAIRLWQ